MAKLSHGTIWWHQSEEVQKLFLSQRHEAQIPVALTIAATARDRLWPFVPGRGSRWLSLLVAPTGLESASSFAGMGHRTCEL